MKIRNLESVRVGRHGTTSTERDGVEGDRRARLNHVNGCNRLLHRVHDNFATTISHVRVVDVVDECALGLKVAASFVLVLVGAEDDSTPFAGPRSLRQHRIRVRTDGLVVPRGKIDGSRCAFARAVQDNITIYIEHKWSTEHLQGTGTAIDIGRFTTDIDARFTHLEDRARV